MRPVLAIRHVPHESLGTLGGMLQQHGLVYTYMDVFRESAAGFHPSSLAGLVVLGGPMNVDEVDAYPFLVSELQWLRQALDADLPVLGICLGAQLLAKALGARVFVGRRKEIGWYPVELSDQALLDEAFRGWSRSETVFQWHGDGFDLPGGAVALASGLLFPYQAFRVGDSAYALQFHLEVTPAMVDKWLDHPANRAEVEALPYIDPRVIREATVARCSRLEELASGFFGQFARACRARA